MADALSRDGMPDPRNRSVDVMEDYRTRADELRDFATYCREVEADTVGTLARTMWRERAEWADACAADFRGAVDLLEQAVDLIAQPSIPDHARKRWQTAVDELLGDGTAAWGR